MGYPPIEKPDRFVCVCLFSPLEHAPSTVKYLKSPIYILKCILNQYRKISSSCHLNAVNLHFRHLSNDSLCCAMLSILNNFSHPAVMSNLPHYLQWSNPSYSPSSKFSVFHLHQFIFTNPLHFLFFSLKCS